MKKRIEEFANNINALIPIDSPDKISNLIRVISKQIKRATFKFNIDQLETDLISVTQESLKQSLKDFFRKVKLNKAQKKVKTTKTISQDKGRIKEKKTKNKPSTPPKYWPEIKGVPDKVVQSAIKRTKIKDETKAAVKPTKSGPPKRAKWNKERIIIGIYEPGISHSETEDDPIHRK